MTKIHSLFLILAIVLPAAVAIDCTTVGMSECGLVGSACEFFRWSNGTNSTNSSNSSNSTGNSSCLAPQTCPTAPKATVWSNATFNCVPCDRADSGLCLSCSTFGFFYKTDQGICTTCGVIYGSSCNSCNATQCLACRAGFALTNNNQACLNTACGIAFCETCASSTTCGACDQWHTLFNGRCICNIANCRVCDSGVCLDCFGGYTLDASKTSCKLTCIDNCDICSSSSTCDSCAIGYVYDSKARRCELNCKAIDENCIACISSTICSVCASGYKPNLFGTACNVQCSDSRCITCAPTNNCSVCTSGFRTRLNSLTGTYSCVRDICTIPFCAACATASTCASCVDLYALSLAGMMCVPSCNVSNCLACATNTTCQTCVGGFRISSGTCIPSCTISNCLLCASAVTCRRCNEGFLLSATRLRCNFNCGIPDCITCSSLTTCSRCLSGSTLSADGTRCIVSCQRGFYLEPVNSTCKRCPTANCLICDSTAQCLTCLDFYYLNTNDFNCYSCSNIANCFYCSQSGPTCLRCKRGYSAVNGACISQASCAVPNCDTCVLGSTTICDTCNEGFGVANGGASCAALTCPGNQILIGSTCTCGAKAYLSGGSCLNCLDENCLSCSSSGCTDCVFGFYPSGSFCISCPDANCKECNSLGCLTCYRGYFRRNGVCEPIPLRDSSKSLAVSRQGTVISCPPGCQTCDIDNFGNLVCLQALDGYIMLNGALHQCAANCQTCAVFLDTTNVASLCLSCPAGFVLSYGSCTSCTDTNALTCSANNANLSLTCKVGFTTLNITTGQSTGTCNACADNCIKCDVTGAGNCDLGGCIPNAIQRSDGCLLCFRGCFKCVGDPNTCVQCNNFYYLDENAACQPCTSNCRTCTSATVCTNCQTGYFLVNNQCITPTAIPNCLSYNSAFTNCTACDFGYTLSSGACALNWVCNATSSCTSCPYGFFLSSKVCLTCPAIANCLSCASSNNTLCIDCSPGFYNDLGTCAACTITGCATCTSAHVCTRAASGYFLVVDITNTFSGAVGTCAGNCLTCINSEITCVSCKPGSRLQGTQCISVNSKTVTILLYLRSLGAGTTVSAAQQTGQMYNFLFGFYFRLGRSLGFRNHRECQRRFRLRRLWRGSVQLQTSLDNEATNVDPATAVANTQDENFGTMGVSVVNNSPSTESTTNLGLILGVSIPLGILLIIIVVLIKVSNRDEEAYMHRPVDQTEKEVREIEAL